MILESVITYPLHGTAKAEQVTDFKSLVFGGIRAAGDILQYGGSRGTK